MSEGRASQAEGKPKMEACWSTNNRGYIVVSKEHVVGRPDQRGVCGRDATVESGTEDQCDLASSFKGSLWLVCAEHMVGSVQRASVEAGRWFGGSAVTQGRLTAVGPATQAVEVGFGVCSEEGPLDQR